jgi:hypothetical protein
MVANQGGNLGGRTAAGAQALTLAGAVREVAGSRSTSFAQVVPRV